MSTMQISREQAVDQYLADLRAKERREINKRVAVVSGIGLALILVGFLLMTLGNVPLEARINFLVGTLIGIPVFATLIIPVNYLFKT